MAYRLDRFDGVPLPMYNPEPDFSQGSVESTLLDSVGSAFDYYGARQRLPRRQTISMKGYYAGVTTYLVDHAGNYIVDESGNFIIVGEGPQQLRAQIDALTAKQGVRGLLYRQRLDDTTVQQWKRARLMQVAHTRKVEERDVLANIGCTFESLMAAWRSKEASESNVELENGAVALSVENGGTVRVEDAIITITATMATITSVRVQDAALTIDWTWAGSLTVGQILVIDCGAQTVRKNGVDAWSGLTLNAGHTADGWLPLAVGPTPLTITCNVAGTLSIAHYDQWL